MDTPARVGGFFSGTGGIEYAFQQAGAQIVFGCEMDPFARATYERNLGHSPYGDITRLDTSALPAVDVVVGGFPCPAFSKAGVSKNRSLGRGVGFDHPVSGQLFFALADKIEALRPRAFFLENVASLVTTQRGQVWNVICERLNEMGYYIRHAVMDASCVVPQHRRRVYIVGFRDWRDVTDFTFPSPSSRFEPRLRDILERLEDWPEYELGEKTWALLQRHAVHHAAKGNGFGYRIADLDGCAGTLLARYYKDGSEILIPQETHRPRRLSPREAFRLMGYPDSYQIDHLSKTQSYKQAGNAVVIPIVQEIASAVLATLAMRPERVA